MKITYYGHSCFSLEINGKYLVFDPFISPNKAAKQILVEEIKADYVLLSHGHEDHVADAETILKNTNATLVANFEVCNWFEKRGIKNIHAMNTGGSYDLPFGRVKMTYAQHSSSMPDGSYGGNPGGFIIESDIVNMYYSGDTALFSDMKLIGENHHLNLAILCIGGNFTMNAQEAAQASEWLKVSTVLGVHYDTFPAIEVDHDAAKRYFHSHGVNLLLPSVGESITA